MPDIHSTLSSVGRITVAGAGIAGTWQALLLARAGYSVKLIERGSPELTVSSSWWAGGMLAPGCESEGAEPVITRLGWRSVELWREELPDLPDGGSLVVAHPRDRTDFERFARLATGGQRIGPERIAALEPALAGRFQEALYFPGESHVEPRRVLPLLWERASACGVKIVFGQDAPEEDAPEEDGAEEDGPEADGTGGLLLDCRGLAGRDRQPDLRGVRGETGLIETPGVVLNRPVRLLHPRWPLYVIPRPHGHFLIGASSIESEDEGAATVRSVLELLSAAYALHPGFGEARVVECGVGLRPAFPDNGPRILFDGRRIAINGLYRHGFLLAPALAELTRDHLVSGRLDREVMRWN